MTNVKMQYYTTLKLAVSKAFEQADIDLNNAEIENKTHLMAQKRGNSWHVRISDEFDSNMTNISDLPRDLVGSQKHIVEMIAECWDEEWTEKEGSE
tara:strand:+ start:194 stop:481 length:288 start_codon:yes stop_codon:yes gene_type:complete